MPEPLILNIETATDVCSVALCLGEEVLALVESQTVNDHAAQLTTYIDQCMDKAVYGLGELDALAVSGGPGSYTSLRIGVATAKGICYALDKPLLAVPTLESLAHAARQIAVDQPTLYCPMIDARRMEVYTALYDEQGREVMSPAAVVLHANWLDEWLQKGFAVVCCGSGSDKARPLFISPQVFFIDLRCSAQHLSPLSVEQFAQGAFVDLAYYEPFYLKPPNITTPKNTGF